MLPPAVVGSCFPHIDRYLFISWESNWKISQLVFLNWELHALVKQIGDRKCLQSYRKLYLETGSTWSHMFPCAHASELMSNLLQEMLCLEEILKGLYVFVTCTWCCPDILDNACCCWKLLRLSHEIVEDKSHIKRSVSLSLGCWFCCSALTFGSWYPQSGVMRCLHFTSHDPYLTIS